MLRLSPLTLAVSAAETSEAQAFVADDGSIADLSADSAGRYLGNLLPQPPEPTAGSRRKRIWELPHATLCPLIGVCLPLATLRRVLGRVSSHGGHGDDYAVHCAAINECARRSPIAEALQRELEQRHALTIKRFAGAKTTAALTELWNAAALRDDVGGALWATLSHARCDGALREQVGSDIHMLQHQLGAGNRADLQRLTQLGDENQALRRELAVVQERSARALAERATQFEALTAQLMRSRADVLRKSGLIDALQQELAAWRAPVAAPEARATSNRQLETQRARIDHLEQQVARWKECARAERQRAESRLAAELEPAQVASGPGAGGAAADAPPQRLRDLAVLCVGGRTASVPIYRRLIEVTGGRFAHHDGGEKHGGAQLEASLAAADLVICQTGCVSHDAYWRVKDHCKRTGKRCVFVDNPSASSLARSLRAVQIDDSTERAPPAPAGVPG